MKRRVLALTVVMTMALTALCGCGKAQQAQEPASEPQQEQQEQPAEPAQAEAPAEEASVEDVGAIDPLSLDDAIGQGIILCNNNLFKAGETCGEGHILMGKDTDEVGEQKCYVLEMFGAYEFQDGNFVKCAGTGAIPCVVTVNLADNGEYSFVSLVEAEDGSNFVDSIKENFPEELWSRCITIEDDDRNELEKQERSYAEEYLSSIGREDTEIGDYSDFEHKLLTDEGVSVEVSNKMLEVQTGDGIEFFCPMWIGEREVLDDNVRYIYKTDYDKKKNEIIFSKILYESGEVLESTVYNAKTGEKID